MPPKRSLSNRNIFLFAVDTIWDGSQKRDRYVYVLIRLILYRMVRAYNTFEDVPRQRYLSCLQTQLVDFIGRSFSLMIVEAIL